MMLVIQMAFSQVDNRIETDRPNESEVPFTVPRKFLQVEAGIYAEKTTSTVDMLNYPVALLKYGLSNHVELRLYSTFTNITENQPFSNKEKTGLEPVGIGVKLSLFQEKKWVPQTSLLLQTGLASLASKSFKTQHVSPKIRLLMENNLTKTLSLTYNIGPQWNGKDTEPEWLFSLSPGIDLGSNWHAFIEAYGFYKKNESPENTLDGGFEYFVHKNLALDICSGIGISSAAPAFFVTLGGSVRFR